MRARACACALRDSLVIIPLFQAVDVVGQAGKPKSITGFQTHTTPVLLAHGERAELATEECIFSFLLHILLVLYRNVHSISSVGLL